MSVAGKVAALALVGSWPCLFSASDVAVLVDVSGTMRTYGAWQKDAADLVTTVLSGGSPDRNLWDCAGDIRLADSFRHHPGARIHLLKFGSTSSDREPFFESPTVLNEVAQLRGVFPLSATQFNEPRTNKSLAQAVGAQLSAGSTTEARLILISDFLVDSDLTPSQLSFVNRHESKARVESPVIFSWHANPRVQVKLIRLSIDTPQPSTPSTARFVRLLPTQVLESPKRVHFRWKLDGQGDVRLYDVTVRDASSRRIEWSAKNLLGNSVIWNTPTGGRKTWQVRAVLASGGEVMSANPPFEVPGSSGLPIVLIVAALACAIGGAYWLAGRNRRKTSAASASSENTGETWKR